MIILFWFSLGAIGYAYVGYAALLWLLTRRTSARAPLADAPLPPVTLLIPVHNEAAVLERKLQNALALDYPPERLQVLVVSDGSTDATAEIVRRYQHDPRLTFAALPERRGKANALNEGLARARGEIVVFTDASIQLEPESLRRIVAPFADPVVGCVSGEDYIADGGGEGLYGRYELLLRRLESRAHSIVGASGSFYAQRRELCQPFPEGMAPDFVSVLATVERGYRALAEPTARGHMSSVRRTQDEFQRKVRTLLRGMTALAAKRRLLNPARYGVFAIELWSHKLMRWLVPVFLVTLLGSSAWLAAHPFYAVALAGQLTFYGMAAAALVFPAAQRFALVRIAVYFTVVNAAILGAWAKFMAGTRVEIWNPSQRVT